MFMSYDQINPYFRAAAYNSWNIENIHKSIAYHMRFFAIRNHAAIVLIRDEEIRVSADTLLILKPGIPYDFHNIQADKRLDLYSCNFDLTQEHKDTCPFILPAHEPDFHFDNIIHSSVEIPELGDIILLQNCCMLCQQVQRIYELNITNKPFSGEIISGIIKSVLFEALQISNTQKYSKSSNMHGEEIANKTMQYIREHCTEDINEKSIAAAMNYHPYYLSKLTQQHYGITPYRYLMQCRLENAIHMLCNSDLSIGAISKACGFSSQAHFTAFVRRETGMIPKILRKNGWNGGSGAL